MDVSAQESRVIHTALCLSISVCLFLCLLVSGAGPQLPDSLAAPDK